MCVFVRLSSVLCCCCCDIYFSFIFLWVLRLNARKIWKCMCTFLIREDIQRDSAPHTNTHTHSTTVTIMTDFRKIVRLQCIVCYHKNHRRSILLECAYIRQMTWFCVLFDEMTSHSKRCTLPTHNDNTNTTTLTAKIIILAFSWLLCFCRNAPEFSDIHDTTYNV